MTLPTKNDTRRLARLATDDALAELESAPSGLTTAQAQARLARFGANRVLSTRRVSAFGLYVSQFRNALVLVLLCGAALALAVGHLSDAIAIAGVVLINSTLGFIQEWRAEQALAALQSMMPRNVSVLRDDQIRTVPVANVVPGDIIKLRCGDHVPADGRLLRAHSMRVDQSAMTGESTAVSKQAVVPQDTPRGRDIDIHELDNVVLAGTTVVHGAGMVLVTTTGSDTRMGQLARLVAESESVTTPLQRRLDVLGRQLAWLTLAVVGAVWCVTAVRGDVDWIEQLFIAVSLAVAGIPEGLPAVVTVTLALGMRRMARHKAIVRRLSAVETLGSTDIICTDKTGTLTRNQLEVSSVALADGSTITSLASLSADARAAGQADLLDRVRVVGALCNDAGENAVDRADPLDMALVRAISAPEVTRIRAELPYYARLPFSTEWKFMATAHRGDVHLLCVKGAPELVLARCAHVADPSGSRALTEPLRDQLVEQNRALADRGLRVVAVAERALSSDFDGSIDTVQDLTWLGLVGFRDPPRDEVPDALGACRRAGVRVIMMTGDQAATAEAIGDTLGFVGAAIPGERIAAMTDDELYDALERTDIVARVLPEHKHRIVRALQRRGHVVAVTGDGVNDAPALKLADIGVAMGQAGTDVAKEAADVVLTDDNFATIVGAVRDGRVIYKNITRFVRYQLSTNVGALVTVFTASALGLGVILQPIQILWINVIMDGPPGLLIATDPATDEMDEAPRKATQPILRRETMLSLLSYGLLMAFGTVLVFWLWGAGQSATANSMAFCTFVLFQVFNLLNVRAVKGMAWRQWIEPRTWMAVIPVVLGQVVLVNLSWTQALFRTEHISATSWLIAAAAASSIYVFGSLARAFMPRRQRP